MSQVEVGREEAVKILGGLSENFQQARNTLNRTQEHWEALISEATAQQGSMGEKAMLFMKEAVVNVFDQRRRALEEETQVKIQSFIENTRVGK